MLLLLLLLHWALPAGATVCPDAVSVEPIAKFCQDFSKVCVDQGDYVLYENRHNPRHTAFTGIPQISLESVHIDYYGFGDVWGTEFLYPNPLLRPATGGEETKELQEPQFSRCTIPLIIYPNYLYVYGEFFMRTVATLYAMQAKGWIDKRMTIAVATLGMRLEPYHHFLLRPFSAWNVTTLGHMGARLPLAVPEQYNPDGQHVRCFRQLLVCQMNYFWKLGIKNPLWSTGQAILDYYRSRLPPLDPELADPSKLRVIISTRSLSSKSRTLVNQDQVWSWCTKFKEPKGVRDWRGTSCIRHEFGRDLLRDVAVAANADVLVGVHGSALFNAFYMPLHSSVVEIRPYQFRGEWPNMYLKDMTSTDDSNSLFWWGINVDSPEASQPGALELERRGNNATWVRDRHTNMRLIPLQYIFERIALTRRDLTAYLAFRKRNEHYITDAMVNLDDKQR
ncbi:MAG: hypothetical protein J3K34DRAFT_441801 [Monoraphidium minutum]|nr:MAG: hypothetical protein J3K34DRAFT_441801 [Monoraphidium minutum]